MKKFLSLFAITMMVSLTMCFTSCSSSDDDGGHTYTQEQLIGTWEVVSANGVGDFDGFTNHSFNLTFNGYPTEDSSEEYKAVYETLVQRLSFDAQGKFLIYDPFDNGDGIDWLQDMNYFGEYSVKGDKIEYKQYFIDDRKVTFDVGGKMTIKELTANKLVVHLSTKDLLGFDDYDEDKPNDYVWYDITYKRVN